jgi:hypothetical protein
MIRAHCRMEDDWRPSEPVEAIQAWRGDLNFVQSPYP